MRRVRYAMWVAVAVSMLCAGQAFGQEAGDFRSAASGNWSEASTWETFDGSNWVAASDAPTGSEAITVRGDDTVRVDITVNSSGYLKVEESGSIEITGGALTFDTGSTYEHARDAGSIPEATWATGSTLLLTGTVQDAPGNRNQDFFNVTFNTPNLGRNRDMGWNGNTIGGDVRVISTSSNRWQMSSVSAGDTAAFTILGDVIVEAGTFAVQGTGNALTTFIVHHYGNIEVTGGNFSIARGSQGSGSGTTTWYLHSGNFSMSDATTQNSNPTAGNARFVFAKADTQQIIFDNVEYGGGDIHFEVADTTTLEITQNFVANGLMINRGEIIPPDSLTFADGGIYEHARDGGSVPTAIWQEGSTALFTGITTTAPDNRGQDYYHLTFNTPGLLSNRDMSLNGNSIGGDITVISTGSARWQLVGGSSGTVTIMGDVIVQDGQFATQGTGSATDVVVDHYGDVVVTGGNFSVSRGSQSSGTGTTTWNLHSGNFSMSNATTQNSNPTPGNAKFVFAREDGVQTIELTSVNYGGGGLSIQVDSAATLDMASTVLGGNGIFNLQAGATLASGHPDGIDGNLQTSGVISLSKEASFTYNGAAAQIAGALLPDSIQVLTIANPEGVAFNDTLRSVELAVETGAIMHVDTLGSVTADSGSVTGSVVNKGVLESVTSIVFGDGAVYQHARDGGSVPTAIWQEGSTALFTGITTTAPDNRGQDYYHLTFNTPGLLSNRDMSLDGNSIGGDITVISTGSARWQLVGGSSGTVTIMGDVIVQDGQFATQGTGSATDVVVDHYGDIVVTGGNFSVSRGSQSSGTGTTTWNLHSGNFSMSNATTQNSNPTPGNAKFVFTNEDDVQTIELTSVNYGGGGLAIEVAGGTTLDFGTSELGGNGFFALASGASLATAHADGIAGTIQSTGDVNFDEGASYVFNGTQAQITSTLMPVVVNGLTIDNDAGVELSQETTINGVLRLVAGEFNNTIPFTLGPDGSISYEGGSLRVPTSVEQLPEIPTAFALLQNYPNPFNPATTIRYDIPQPAHVTLSIFDIMGRKVAELVDGEYAAGAYQVSWDARDFASGVYYYRITAGDFSSVRKLVLAK